MTGLSTSIRRGVRTHGLWLTAVLTVSVFFGMLLFGDATETVEAIRTVEVWRIALVFVLATAGYGVRFLKWEYLLRELDVTIPLRTSLLVFLCGLMMVVTPGKAGELWKGWFLRDLRGVPLNRTTTVVGAERVTDLLALAAFAFLGLYLFDRSSVVLVAMTACFLSGLVVLQWRSLCLRILGRLETVPVVGQYADELSEFYENVYTLFRLRPLVVTLIVSLVAWGLEGAALWIVLEGFVPESSVLLALFVFGLGSVVGAVSLLPGGLAATEASMVGLFVVLGYSRDVAVSSTLIIRVGTLWYGAALGTTVFVLYRLRRRSDDTSDE